MDSVTEVVQGTRKRTQTQTEETEDHNDRNGWKTVENKKKKRAKTNPQNGHSYQSVRTMPRLNKFKVLAANSAEAYRTIDSLTEKTKTLRLIAKPNLKSEWIITPLDDGTYNHLKTCTTIKLQELKQEDKTKKAIVVGFPLDMPESELTKHSQISSAARMKNKEGVLTRTMLCTFTGKIPDKVDLGHWGKFATKTYYPEPLRCYNCQKFGHHKSACTSPAICAVCSGRHETEHCITRHKGGQGTTLRCPNCKSNHPAWHRRCPARINKIQAALPKEREDAPTRGRQAPTPAPRTTFYTNEQLQRARSLSRSRKPQAVPPKTLPRTIYLDKEPAKKEIMKYTSAVLQSVGLKTSQQSLSVLADMLVTDLLNSSKAIFNFTPPSSIIKSSTSVPISSTSSSSSPSVPISSTSSSSSSSSTISPSAVPTSSSSTTSLSSSDPSYTLPPPFTSRPSYPHPLSNIDLPPNQYPHPYSTSDFPTLNYSQPFKYPYTFLPTNQPSLPNTSISQAAAAAAADPTSLKHVSFTGNLTRRRDHRQ